MPTHTLRIKKEFLDKIDTLVEKQDISRSDFFGAAVNMLLENPKLVEKDPHIFTVDEDALKNALKDGLEFNAVRTLLGSKGLTEVNGMPFILNPANKRVNSKLNSSNT